MTGLKKIIVNTRLLLPGRLEGIGWFSHQVLQRITKQNPDIVFHFLFDRPFDDSFIYANNIIPHVIAPPTRHPLLWYTWFEWMIPSVIQKIQADLFFSPDGFLSLRAQVPSLPVIHDINFFHEPKDLAWSHAKFYNHFFPKYAQKAQRICTVSEYSKQDIATHYGIDPDKIDVVYNGIHDHLNPINDEQKTQIKQQVSAGKPYFFFIGSIHPRKNIVRLLQAFDIFKARTKSDMLLMIAGNKKWWTQDMEQTLQNLQYKADVKLLGRISDEEYSNYLAAAFCLVYPSLFEGFGIPMIEAMHCRIPVIASNISSMPEIGGNSVLYCEPESTEDISQKMIQLYKNQALRQELMEKGVQRSLDFSWEKTAERVWTSICKTI